LFAGNISNKTANTHRSTGIIEISGVSATLINAYNETEHCPLSTKYISASRTILDELNIFDVVALKCLTVSKFPNLHNASWSIWRATQLYEHHYTNAIS